MQVVITGLTKQKLGDTFAGLRNVTLATSNGLVYSWGQNLLPARHETLTQLQTLASAAAAAALAANPQSELGTEASEHEDNSCMKGAGGSGVALPISSVLACEENSTYFLVFFLLWHIWLI